MANFGISVIGSNSLPDIEANGSTITVIDHSNYDTNTESGHTQADFSSYYKIKFLNPDGTTYVFSSVGDGDASLTVPASCVLPITTVYTYTTGDGVYALYMYSVPTYNNAASYSVDSDYVYYNGSIYKCIQVTAGGNDPTDTTYWEVITDIDDLPTKYRIYQRFAVICDIQQCFMTKVHLAYCAVEGIGCNNELCKNEDFLTAAELQMVISQVPILVDRNDWAGVSHVINFGSELCCCND